MDESTRPGSFATDEEAENPAESAGTPTAAERALAKDSRRTGDASLPGETLVEEGDAAVDAAIAKAELHMKDFDVLQAETLLAKTLCRLDSSGLHQAAARLRRSEIFEQVLDLVAQYDGTVEMMFNDKFRTLYENEAGKFEIYQENGTWFDYRMTVNLEAPLAECLSTEHELDLVPKAQKMIVSEPLRIGPNHGFFSAWMAKLPVLFMQADLLFEALRVRDRCKGYLLESIRSDFPANGRYIPPKSWRSMRPWTFTANLWAPRGAGQRGTCLVQVTRVDCMMNIPQWILNFVFRQVASNFMSDLQGSTTKASEGDSPWASRICKDETGLYSELRKVEEAAKGRSEVTGLPAREFFEREWRLRPKPVDTRPPASR